jgi:hypothetical protein
MEGGGCVSRAGGIWYRVSWHFGDVGRTAQRVLKKDFGQGLCQKTNCTANVKYCKLSSMSEPTAVSILDVILRLHVEINL